MQLSDAARKYVGTPFKHRGRDRTLDCVGMARQAYIDAYGVVPSDFVLYGSEPFNDGLVERMIGAIGNPILIGPVRERDLAANDIVAMRFEVNPHHIAVVGEHNYGGTRALTVIHACGMNGRVLEQRLVADMISRITHVWRRSV